MSEQVHSGYIYHIVVTSDAKDATAKSAPLNDTSGNEP